MDACGDIMAIIEEKPMHEKVRDQNYTLYLQGIF